MKATFVFLVMKIAIINVLGYASAQEADTTPPRVVKVDPPNGATDVKPGVTNLSVTFSEEMRDENRSWTRLDEGRFPQVIERPKYDEAHTTFSMSALLLPGRTYAVGINSPPFTGTIDQAVSDDPKSVILIVPTHENDKAVQDKIHAYVKEIHDKFFKDFVPPILTDEEALKRDLSTNALIVYGTTTGNLWLAQHIAELPVRIESDKIVADTVYSGAHLRFISAWPNPQNPQKGVVIYTAQQAEDVVGIDSVYGSTDYVIAKGTEVLKAANYKKQDGRWTF